MTTDNDSPLRNGDPIGGATGTQIAVTEQRNSDVTSGRAGEQIAVTMTTPGQTDIYEEARKAREARDAAREADREARNAHEAQVAEWVSTPEQNCISRPE